ncbi:hypothetical protein FG386_002541 [Cryptosporidium ryanae]|uniref:uncharacterized protein n=1 Tax=Cryptosporidium ryanae TaxID=515981 RepID=UPI003519E56D|nr:hypothetical protein FG386_002541 [Cryptosporidium ryanae]
MKVTKVGYYVTGIITLIILFNSCANCWKFKHIFRKKKKSKQIRVLSDQEKKQFDRQIPNCEDYGLHGCDPTTPDACTECYGRCGRQCEEFLWLSLEAVNFRMLPRAESQKECKLPNKKKSTRILCYTTAGRRHFDPTEQIVETMSISSPIDLEDQVPQVDSDKVLSQETLHGFDEIPATEKMKENEQFTNEASAVMFRKSGQSEALISSLELREGSDTKSIYSHHIHAGDTDNKMLYIICGAVLIFSMFALFFIILLKKRTKANS